MNQNLNPDEFGNPPSPREVQQAVDIIGESEAQRIAPAGLGGASPEQLRAIVGAAR